VASTELAGRFARTGIREWRWDGWSTLCLASVSSYSRASRTISSAYCANWCAPAVRCTHRTAPVKILQLQYLRGGIRQQTCPCGRTELVGDDAQFVTLPGNLNTVFTKLPHARHTPSWCANEMFAIDGTYRCFSRQLWFCVDALRFGARSSEYGEVCCRRTHSRSSSGSAGHQASLPLLQNTPGANPFTAMARFRARSRLVHGACSSAELMIDVRLVRAHCACGSRRRWPQIKLLAGGVRDMPQGSEKRLQLPAHWPFGAVSRMLSE